VRSSLGSGKKAELLFGESFGKKPQKKLPNGQKKFPNSPLGGGNTFLNTVKIRLIRLQTRRSSFLQLFMDF